MSWTKIISCDICGKQHSFFREVMSERQFIADLLGWVSVKNGRSYYDICKECRGDSSIQELQKFFRENPVEQNTVRELFENAFVKGWNSNR